METGDGRSVKKRRLDRTESSEVDIVGGVDVERPLGHGWGVSSGQPPPEQASTWGAAGPAVAHNGIRPASPVDLGICAGPSGAYTQREAHLEQLEEAGDLNFMYVVNDGEKHNNLCLLHLKNIYSRQLPNMPKEYITRLLFDRRHRSVAIVRRNGSVMGGITYRPFPHAAFGEIAFCAVTAMEQVKGFGTRLMNYTKEYARSNDKLRYFLTYADNNAVGYFAKQGFTKEITSDKEQWHSYIKEYDGGTLMECLIHDRLPYTRFPDMIKSQRMALDTRIRKLSKSHLVYPGLTCFKTEQRAMLRPAEIPGVIAAGWTPDDNPAPAPYLMIERRLCPPTPENLQQFLDTLVRSLQAQAEAWPFLEPVDRRDVPDYYDIIKDPMDLSTMQRRVQSGTYYVTLAMFKADFELMKRNCETYNTLDTVYCKLMWRLHLYFLSYLNSNTGQPPAVDE